MSSQSIGKKLQRVRRPRVHINYEVNIDGAMEKIELPFVVGVLADLSGNPAQPLAKMKERKFVDINPDNFNSVLEKAAPRVTLSVENKLTEGGGKLPVELKFKSMDDFEPGRVADQVPALKKLLDTRNQLRDLMTKVDRSDELEKLLERVLQNESDLKALSSQLGLDKPKE